eukprot:CAMPEP_0170488566 /NCGR_PEP_ID=MMETSP0208-20121228/7098_1 /TAXON_ID=197538 /ORGANISM="Strombidium inclinatum, Strain S3" /LENGTH=60 /DNA_ID=CAMNT_0010763187 /DNA_START=2281 /DNA_END=2463 /DNA_ORIENTATION=-
MRESSQEKYRFRGAGSALGTPSRPHFQANAVKNEPYLQGEGSPMLQGITTYQQTIESMDY